ncbi:MAG: FitA-like ribbon-helix-helix domain-containing protein [Gammaproteobacteria bacterium]
MSTLVIKNLPEDLHARLKEQAQRHHRSVTKEVVSLIESGLGVQRSESELPPPVELKGGPETREEAEAVIAEPARERSEAWQAYFRRLQRRPDGSYYNPDGIDDEAFFEELERFRAESRFPPRDPFKDE